MARKYGIDYAMKKDKTGEIPKYLIFFKVRDGDALTAAFKEYSAKSIQKETERPSTISQLRKFIDMVRNMNRVYCRAYSLEHCYMEIEKNLGTMYDPVIGGFVLEHWRDIVI